MEWRQFIKPNRFLVVHKMTWLRPEPPQEISDYWMELYPGIRKEKVKIYDNSWPGGVWEVEPEIVVATAAAMTGSVRVDRGNGKTLLGKGFGGIENDEYNVVFWKSETE